MCFISLCDSLFFKPFTFRFLFILLGPKGKAKSYHEIGRSIATLMSDEVILKYLYFLIGYAYLLGVNFMFPNTVFIVIVL